MKDLWICGQCKNGEFPNIIWDFQGIFDSEEKARKACRDENYFIMPVKLNEKLSHETVENPAAYYPFPLT